MRIEGVKRATRRSHDMQYWFSNQEMLEDKYAGKWIAIEGGKLAGVGDSLQEAADKAQQAGAKEPLMVDVKSKELRNAFLVRACLHG
jgi:Family of unknown function (DUF5678)